MEVNVTRHGEKRIRKRLGLKKKSADRIAEKALERGVTHAEAKGSLGSYMDSLFLSHGTANNMRIYNRAVYVFRNNVLITVLALPKRYIGLADKLQKQKTASPAAVCV